MKTETTIDGTTLTVRRIYAASLVDVFDAWIDASKTTHWWGCGQTTKVTSTIDAKPGGEYKHLMHIEGVGDHMIDGTLIEYDPPNALAYTLPSGESDETMQVRVSFRAVGDGTEVTLVHSVIVDGWQGTIEAGWTASFERLAGFFDGARRAA